MHGRPGKSPEIGNRHTPAITHDAAGARETYADWQVTNTSALTHDAAHARKKLGSLKDTYTGYYTQRRP
jgi:hypothetical protein